jgi:hypothetical protein
MSDRKPKPMTAKRRADISDALDLIATSGTRMDLLEPALSSGYALKLSFSTGTHRATMLGITGTATSGNADALQSWARAARRALLNDGGA